MPDEISRYRPAIPAGSPNAPSTAAPSVSAPVASPPTQPAAAAETTSPFQGTSSFSPAAQGAGAVLAPAPVGEGAAPTSKAHVRFWRGVPKEGLPLDEVKRRLNEHLVPDTTTVGGGRGLDAYLPMLMDPGQTGLDVAEAALIVYQSQEEYDALAGTAEFEVYGKSHSDIFTRPPPTRYNHNGTQVASFLKGPVPRDKVGAYLVSGAQVNWQDGQNRFRAFARGPDIDDARWYAAVDTMLDGLRGARTGGLNDAAVLVDKDQVMVYENWASLAKMEQAQPPTPTDLKKVQESVLQREARADASSLEPGKGVSVQFQPTTRGDRLKDAFERKLIPDLQAAPPPVLPMASRVEADAPASVLAAAKQLEGTGVKVGVYSLKVCGEDVFAAYGHCEAQQQASLRLFSKLGERIGSATWGGSEGPFSWDKLARKGPQRPPGEIANTSTGAPEAVAAKTEFAKKFVTNVRVVPTELVGAPTVDLATTPAQLQDAAASQKGPWTTVNAYSLKLGEQDVYATFAYERDDEEASLILFSTAGEKLASASWGKQKGPFAWD
ncbi:MAG: hypothetical protein HY901_09085 [Deltaproteobacteria bacterium]|nr:hypothetical protein [Deltaproteobacteria bacterium]